MYSEQWQDMFTKASIKSILCNAPGAGNRQWPSIPLRDVGGYASPPAGRAAGRPPRRHTSDVGPNVPRRAA